MASIVIYTCYCFFLGKPMLSSSLPPYSGPHNVGVIDIEVPVDQRKLSDATSESTGQLAFQLETVLFSLYYPASKKSLPSKAKHYWISRPVGLVAQGYARFAHVDNSLFRGIFTTGLLLLGGGNRISANVDVPLLEDGTFPVVIFSHGMASSRTSYSQYMGELASHGYVVAAIEHRDGSGPASIITQHGKADRILVHFGLDDLVSGPGSDNAGFKQEQLAMRQAEVEETIRVMKLINDGQGSKVFEQNSRKEGMDIHHWQDRFEFDHLTIAGHSYGATLALQTLKGAPSSTLPIHGCIALDPGKQSGPLNDDINVPLLIVHSNSWSRSRSLFFGRPHFSVVKQVAESVLNRGKAAWFMTSLGSTHPSVTDAPLICPTLLKWTTGATLDVKEALKQYVRVSLDFLEFSRTRRTNGALSVGVTHPEYDKQIDHKPSQESKKQNEEVKNIVKYWQVHVAPEEI